jgi:transposase
MDKRRWVGIDPSAKKFCVAFGDVTGAPTRREFPNTPAGHRQALRQLTRGVSEVRICLEPTGTYSVDLALALAEPPTVQLLIPNPRALRDFASAQMHRDKDDDLDAEVALEYGRRMEFVPWRRPSAAALQLRLLARRLRQTTADLQAEQNRRHAAAQTRCTPAAVLADLDASIADHRRRIQQLCRTALELVAHDPLLRRRLQILDSIPGIASRAAIRILGEIAVLPDNLDARQLVAYAGLYPRRFRSGASVRRRKGIGNVGNHALRDALFMPALVAIRHQPTLRAFHDRLIANGLAPLPAVVAVMRKLLHIIYTLLARDELFDAQRLAANAEKVAPAA